MTHENEASIVPGSTHINRKGEHVFICGVYLDHPWGMNKDEAVIKTYTKEDCVYRNYRSCGRFYRISDSEWDLICEYKEPQVYEAYLIAWSDGDRNICDSLEFARSVAHTHSNQGRRSWKIIKLTGTEDDLTLPSFPFNPLAHEQTK